MSEIIIGTSVTSTVIGITISALLTLAIYSFLYKDNVFYKAAEYIFVGASAGYLLSVQYNNVMYPNVFIPLQRGVKNGDASEFVVLIPTILGLLMLTMLVPSLSVLSRIPISYVVGFGAGAGAMAVIQTDIVPQINATIMPVLPLTYANINNLVVVIGVVCSLIYFFFSTEHKGLVFGTGSKVGIIFLMVTFGAQFGTTIMGRVQLLINRGYFLLGDWLHLIK